jgi:hypothetical protein
LTAAPSPVLLRLPLRPPLHGRPPEDRPSECEPPPALVSGVDAGAGEQGSRTGVVPG